jgi:hypoxanthine phosphoribosyltransferase
MSCPSGNKSEFEEYHLKHNPQVQLDDVLDFRNELMDFMQIEVVDNIDKWDVILTKNRKGTIIFYDLVKKERVPSEILPITDYEIYKESNDLTEKRILLFDDSIKSGDTLTKLVKKLEAMRPKSISIVSLLVTENIDNFESKCGINVIYWKKSEKTKEFTLDYLNQFRHYIDYLCMPQTKDLIVEKFCIPAKLSKSEIISLFTINGIEPKHYDEREIDFPGSLPLYHSFLEDDYNLDYIDKENNGYVLKFKDMKLGLNQLKIRFFVHFNESSTEIHLEYISVSSFNEILANCKSNFKYLDIACNQHKDVKSSDCLICFQYNSYQKIREEVIPHLISKGNNKNIELLPWCTKGRIVDENCFKFNHE